jgi:hypothetical protein
VALEPAVVLRVVPLQATSEPRQTSEANDLGMDR